MRIRPTIRSDRQLNLKWSMEPIFLWLQVFGVASGHLQPAFRRYTVVFLGVGMMVWVTSSRIQFILDYVRYAVNINLNELPGRISNNELRIHSLNQLQAHCSTILMCLSLFIVGHLQWESLWKNACEIEQTMRLDEKFSCSLRKMVYIATVMLAMVKFKAPH